MVQVVSKNARNELTLVISYLVAKFGRRQTLFAVLRTYHKGKGRPPDTIGQLSDHLRQDIGLPPTASARPPRRR